MTFAFYVDSEDRLRRVEVERTGEKTTLRLTKWDSRVTVKVPANSDLVASP